MFKWARCRRIDECKLPYIYLFIFTSIYLSHFPKFQQGVCIIFMRNNKHLIEKIIDAWVLKTRAGRQLRDHVGPISLF